jgi:hypothetical protein
MLMDGEWGKHGTTAKMKTGNVGRGRSAVRGHLAWTARPADVDKIVGSNLI